MLSRGKIYKFSRLAFQSCLFINCRPGYHRSTLSNHSSFVKMYQRALLPALMAAARAQQVGTQKAETHPSLTWNKCTASGSCTQQAGSVVIDANWRWVHSTKDTTNCYTGNTVWMLYARIICRLN